MQLRALELDHWEEIMRLFGPSKDTIAERDAVIRYLMFYARELQAKGVGGDVIGRLMAAARVISEGKHIR